MFQFPALLILTDLLLKSHSGISGSKVTCTSPEHFAACRALLHHCKSSHPPNRVSGKARHRGLDPRKRKFEDVRDGT